MLQSSDIRKKAMNKWPQFRKHLVSLILFDENDDFFPLKIIGDKTPINDWSKMIDEYSEIISYSKEKTNIGYSIVWEERKTRDRGRCGAVSLQRQLSQRLFSVYPGLHAVLDHFGTGG